MNTSFLTELEKQFAALEESQQRMQKVLAPMIQESERLRRDVLGPIEKYATELSAIEESERRWRAAFGPMEKYAKELSAIKRFANEFAATEECTKLRSALSSLVPDVLKIELPAPRSPELLVDPDLASEVCRRLLAQVGQFQQGLDQAHEVGVSLVNFGHVVTIRLRGIGYSNPPLMIFYGESEVGEPMQLIQHVSQTNVALKKMPRADQNRPKAPIGFGPHQI